MNDCGNINCANGPTLWLDPLAAPELCADCAPEHDEGPCDACNVESVLYGGLCDSCRAYAEGAVFG